MDNSKKEIVLDGKKKQKRAGKRLRRLPGYDGASPNGIMDPVVTSQVQYPTMSTEYEDVNAPEALWSAKAAIRVARADIESDVSDADDDEVGLACVRESVEHSFRDSHTSKLLGIMRSDPPQTPNSTFPLASTFPFSKKDEKEWYVKDNERLKEEKRELIEAMKDLKVKYWTGEAANKQLRKALAEEEAKSKELQSIIDEKTA